jgi:hypothetical protein
MRPSSAARAASGVKRTGAPPANRFARVAAAARSLPGVEEATAWGAPALKVRGRMFACMATHKSAEPDSLVVMMAMADRDALVADAPDVYYLKDHYVGYPCVLVRLARVSDEALHDLVAGAHRYVARQPSRPRRADGGPAVSGTYTGSKAARPSGRRRSRPPE